MNGLFYFLPGYETGIVQLSTHGGTPGVEDEIFIIADCIF